MAQVAIAPDLFTWPSDEPALIGATCADCGATSWPAQAFCPRCSSPNMEQRELPRRGTLVAWTTQSFLPKDPYIGTETNDDFQPFGVGLIQLDDIVRVETRLTVADPAVLRSGMEMEFVVIPFVTDADGNEVMIHAFAPCAPSTNEQGA